MGQYDGVLREEGDQFQVPKDAKSSWFAAEGERPVDQGDLLGKLVNERFKAEGEMAKSVAVMEKQMLEKNATIEKLTKALEQREHEFKQVDARMDKLERLLAEKDEPTAKVPAGKDKK